MSNRGFYGFPTGQGIGSGAASFSYATITANHTVTTGDSGLAVDATSGPITITLLSAVGITQLFAIKRVDSSAHTVTIVTTGGQTIDGVSNRALYVAEQEYVLGSHNGNWRIYASFFPSPLTTLGDVVVADSNALAARLGVGTDGNVLTADSTQTLGVSWAPVLSGSPVFLDGVSPLTPAELDDGSDWAYAG